MGQEIKLLQIVSVTMLVLLSILFLYLIMRKYIENKQNERVQKREQELTSPIFQYLQFSKEVNLELDESKVDKVALENILSHYSEVIEGEQEEKRLHSLAHTFLKNHYVKELGSRNWSRRMNVLYKIEDFQLRDLGNKLVEMLHLKKAISVEEKIQIYRVLSSFQYENIYSLLNHDEDLTEKDYRSMLLRLEADPFYALLSSFPSCREPLQLAILDVISLRGKIDHTAFLETVFHSNEGEIRLRALKAIASIGYVQSIHTYLPLAESSSWQERMMVAKLLGKRKDLSYIPTLRGFMHDSSWWVRSQAAESIMNYKNGKEVLQEILDHSEDMFAKDMALEWINKGVIQ